MEYKDLILERLKREVLIKGGYLSLYTRICIVHSHSIVRLLSYLKETSDFYRTLYKTEDEDPYLIARRFLMPL